MTALRSTINSVAIRRHASILAAHPLPIRLPSTPPLGISQSTILQHPPAPRILSVKPQRHGRIVEVEMTSQELQKLLHRAALKSAVLGGQRRQYMSESSHPPATVSAYVEQGDKWAASAILWSIFALGSLLELSLPSRESPLTGSNEDIVPVYFCNTMFGM